MRLPALLARAGCTAAIASLMALSAAMPARADAQRPNEASVQTLLALTKSENLLSTTSANVEQQMRAAMQAALQGRTPTESERGVMDRMISRTAAVVRAEMAWDSMRPLLTQIYQDTFTQEEVDGQIAFYRTPIGAAVIDKMPVAVQASMAAMQQRLGALMPQLQAINRLAMQELRAVAVGNKAERATPPPPVPPSAPAASASP